MSERLAISAALGWLEIEGVARLVERPFVVVDRDTGIIEALHAGAPDPEHRPALVHDLGHALLLPGFVNAHSHAFQRRIRGVTHRRASGDPSTFWSWRQAMYAAANSLDPEGVYAQTRACFAEMLARGITCVGEFHYLHHDPEGRPYADRNELSKQIVRAADEVGIRLVLLEVYYARGGVDHAGPLPEQRRFCDGSVDAYLRRIDELRGAIPGLRLGITPHSVRAVRAAELGLLAAYAETHELPIHSHVSEQPLENQQCHAEHGRTPTQVFADAGCLARPHAFTAVHAIHVSAGDRSLLADQQVCACPTTEADLGDGIVPAREFLAGGTTLALGSDSNAVIDLVQEARLLEMHERLRDQTRLVLHDDEGRVAPVLLAAATIGGARALAWPELGRLAIGSPFDAAVFDLDHRMLAGVPAESALDALLLAGTAEPILQVWVGGKRRA
ncbi:formimidoylglutamate deiminase [Nannocystaceae bacterium ST9]